VVCGDIVNLRLVGHEGVIESIAPRKSLLYRADAWCIKPIAANVTQVGVVVAARPSFSLELAERCLLAAEAEAIAAFVVLNKIDLPEHAAARERLERIVRLGYPLVEVSAKADASPLSAQLAGHTTLLIGQSGMGKSTLVNALVPDAATATAEHSEALDSGRHTTTYTRLYRIDANSALIDSPGLQEFALHHLDRHALERAFVDFRPYLGTCRFRDCQHASEPGCAIREAVAQGRIDPERLALFRRLCATSATDANRL
jgi:ribosome biogenesis GTPase